MQRTLAFDLDDTLYDERDYVRSGLAQVAAAFAERFDTAALDMQWLFDDLLAAGGREQIFDRALQHLGIAVEPALVAAMVECYRAQQPQLALFDGVETLLQTLQRDYRLVLVTDGLPLMQRNKVNGLGIADAFEHIVYCWEHDAPKPDSTGYRLAIGDGLAGAVIIGDNPVNDGQPARELGIPFIRVRGAGRFAQQPGGDVVVDSVTELEPVLARV